MSNGCFRVKKGFTVVQNNIARDNRLSIKAKGLYLVIQSYITMPDREWHKTDFMNMVSEGKGAFESAWKELKDNGYIKCYVTSNGHGTNREYDLLDTPEEGHWEIFIKQENDLTECETNEQERETLANTGSVQVPENQVPGNQVAGNQVPGNHAHGNQVPGNRGYINKDSFNNTKSINIINNNHSFIQTDTIVENEGMNDEPIPDITFDLAKPVDESLFEFVEGELQENQCIPLDYAFEKEKFKIALAELSGWNEYLERDNESDINRETFRLILDIISEMGTTMGRQDIKGSAVSYKNVIDCLNRIMKDSTSNQDYPLMFFIECTVEKYVNATKCTNIMNSRKYLKSMIWENFHNYKLNWESSIHNTSQNLYDEFLRKAGIF